MKQKKLFDLILPAITLVLEILPYGAVCFFASPEGEIHRETYSYFSLVPYGYANFAPFLTAVLTCIVLLLTAGYCFTGKCAKAIKVTLCVAVALSLCPLLLGINYFSAVGILITVTLLAQLIVFSFARNRKQ